MLWTEDPTQNLREGRSACWNVEQWRSQSQTFADMAVFDAASTTLTRADGAEQIVGGSISPNLLPLLGVQPVQGHSWSSEEAEQRQRLVLISHRFWQARFGGSNDAVGATIVLNGLPSQIIGILPAETNDRKQESNRLDLIVMQLAVTGGDQTSQVTTLTRSDERTCSPSRTTRSKEWCLRATRLRVEGNLDFGVTARCRGSDDCSDAVGVVSNAGPPRATGEDHERDSPGGQVLLVADASIRL